MVAIFDSDLEVYYLWSEEVFGNEVFLWEIMYSLKEMVNENVRLREWWEW